MFLHIGSLFASILILCANPNFFNSFLFIYFTLQVSHCSGKVFSHDLQIIYRNLSITELSFLNNILNKDVKYNKPSNPTLMCCPRIFSPDCQSHPTISSTEGLMPCYQKVWFSPLSGCQSISSRELCIALLWLVQVLPILLLGLTPADQFIISFKTINLV